MATLLMAIEDSVRLFYGKFDIVLSFVLLELQYLFAVTSISTIASISVERLWAVVFPFRHRDAGLTLYISLISVPWLIAGTNTSLEILTVFSIIHWKVFFYVDWFITVAVNTIIFGSYFGIFVKAKCGSSPINNQRNASREKKMAITLFLVTVASLATWFPINIYYQTRTIEEKANLDMSTNLTILCLVALSLCNSGVNILVYMIRMPLFRKALSSLLCEICGICTRTSTANVQAIPGIPATPFKHWK
jgi:uncharacterized membrane protein YidH (DUF202 family)